MKKALLGIVIITIISKIFGFMRESVLSYYYGATSITDVYVIAITISATLSSFFFAAITNTYIPMYGRIKNDNGEDAANQYTRNLINIGVVIGAVLLLLVYVFTAPLIGLFAIGFKGEELELAILFTRINAITMLASGALMILIGYLQIKKNFVIPALIAIPMNFTVIAAIIISHKTHVSILIWGTMLSTFLQLLFLLPWVYRAKYRHRLKISFKDEHIRTMLVLVMPVLIGTSVNQMNTLVDRTLASSLVVGGISALNYASKLTGLVQGLFIYSVVVVIYPTISRMASEGELDELKRVVAKSINGIMLLIMPATIGMMVLAKPIVKLMFGRGAFDESALIMTSGALFFYAIGLMFLGIQEILSKTFYALQETKIPMYNAVIAVAINIVLNFILSHVMGISGLALATSISSVVCALLMFWSLRKKTGALGIKMMLKSAIKILIASSAMGAGAYFSYVRLSVGVGQTLGLLIAIGIGTCLYGGMIIVMKVPEVDEIIVMIKSKINNDSV